MQPLSQEAQELYRRQSITLDNANKGLLFERFYSGYEADFTIVAGQDGVELNKLVGLCGRKEELASAAARRVQLAGTLQGEFGVFRTDWNFVSGMGNAHPVENGFSWHPVYGTPYLPGSSVKGLLRAWMEEWANAEQSKEERTALIHEWFGRDAGKQGAKDSGKAGDLIFFDALPVEQPCVSVDIMTPHMSKWYEQGGERITPDSQPGDWHNPVPIPFLVASNARFVFAIAPRTPQAKAAGLAREAMEHLKHALAWLGAGAKTAAGYGHMSFDKRDSLLRFKSDDERRAVELELAQVEQERKLAEAGIAVGKETWERVLVSKVNAGSGDLIVEFTGADSRKELASGKLYSQLSEKGKAKARDKKKKLYVSVDVERQGNMIAILELRELE